MTKYKIFAAVNIGSTAISMKIAEISGKKISVIDSVKYDISIGKETYNLGKISYNAVDEICSCLEKFVYIMESYKTDDYVCYATTAVREALNSEYIIEQINIRTGLKVSIISNEEECFLHYKAFALNTDYFDNIIEEGAIITDVLSGSIQISKYEKSELKYSQNLPMGSLRVTELLSGFKNNTSTFTDILEEYIKTEIENYKRSFFKNTNYKYFIAFGSQINNLKKLIGADDDKITKEQFDEIYKILSERSFDSISDEFNITYNDVELMISSVFIYRMFMKNDDFILAPNISLEDGMCVEYIEKSKLAHTNHIFTNDTISSASYYAGKYDVSIPHYEKLIEFLSVIFNSISKKFGLSKRDFILLKTAAIFSDTGLYININDYNRYSYDIVKANSILGLSQKEHEIVSFVVLFQDGVFDFEEYNYLPKNRRLLISKLSAILSLAKSLDFEYNQKIDKIKSRLKDGELNITAYTDKDIVLIKRQFDISAKFFEEVFGIKTYLNKAVK